METCEELRAAPIDTHLVGSRVLVYDEVSSTSDKAFELPGDGLVVVADRQTRGRGRRGRPWHSPPGLGLWLSAGFDGPPAGLLFAGALAVRDAARPWAALDVKWPNDLVFMGRKVCGLLLEQRGARCVLGIGINVRQQPADFPPELRDRATSLETAGGRPCDRGALMRAVLTALDRRVMVLREDGPGPMLREWVLAAGIQHRRVRAGSLEGEVRSVDESGALLVETGAGLKPVLTNSIVWLDEE